MDKSMKSHISHARDGEVVQQECESDCQPWTVCAGIEEEGMPVCRKCKLSAHILFSLGPEGRKDSTPRGDSWMCETCGGSPSA